MDWTKFRQSLINAGIQPTKRLTITGEMVRAIKLDDIPEDMPYMRKYFEYLKEKDANSEKGKLISIGVSIPEDMDNFEDVCEQLYTMIMGATPVDLDSY